MRELADQGWANTRIAKEIGSTATVKADIDWLTANEDIPASRWSPPVDSCRFVQGLGPSGPVGESRYSDGYAGHTISFEGVDGVGKTTQVERLRAHIEAQGA